MTVTCINQCCNESVLLLPTKVDAPIEYDNFVLFMGYTVDHEITEYHITVGAEYTVYGILICKNQIRYLVQDDDGIPRFCPDELFRIQKESVYWDWEIKSFLIEGKPLLIIGYPAMEGSYDSLIDLASRKGEAIKQFLKYKEHSELYCDIFGDTGVGL